MAYSFCSIKVKELMILLEFQPTFVLLLCILNLVFSPVATLGNLLVIRALWKASSIPVNLKMLFMSLAFADLAVGLYVQPMIAVIMAMMLGVAAKGSRDFEFLCPYVLTANVFLAYFMIATCAFTIAAIAVDRFISVYLHLRYQELVTEKRVGAAIIIIWLTSGLASFALLSIPSKNYLTSVVIQTLWLLVISVAYVRIYKVVRYHQNQIYGQHQIQTGQARTLLHAKKSAWSAFHVYIVCLVCCLPNLFASIPLIVDNYEEKYLLAFYASSLVIFINSSINPLLYCWRYREIRVIISTTVQRICPIHSV